MDYYKMKNIISDTQMRNKIGGKSDEEDTKETE
jgi:uncharacterized protein YqfA (UPF0365 family)